MIISMTLLVKFYACLEKIMLITRGTKDCLMKNLEDRRDMSNIRGLKFYKLAFLKTSPSVSLKTFCPPEMVRVSVSF